MLREDTLYLSDACGIVHLAVIEKDIADMMLLYMHDEPIRVHMWYRGFHILFDRGLETYHMASSSTPSPAWYIQPTIYKIDQMEFTLFPQEHHIGDNSIKVYLPICFHNLWMVHRMCEGLTYHKYNPVIMLSTPKTIKDFVDWKTESV